MAIYRIEELKDIQRLQPGMILFRIPTELIEKEEPFTDEEFDSIVKEKVIRIYVEEMLVEMSDIERATIYIQGQVIELGLPNRKQMSNIVESGNWFIDI